MQIGITGSQCWMVTISTLRDKSQHSCQWHVYHTTPPKTECPFPREWTWRISHPGRSSGKHEWPETHAHKKKKVLNFSLVFVEFSWTLCSFRFHVQHWPDSISDYSTAQRQQSPAQMSGRDSFSHRATQHRCRTDCHSPTVVRTWSYTKYKMGNLNFHLLHTNNFMSSKWTHPLLWEPLL